MKDGNPCYHRGCLSHLTHPCEGCGRIGGYPITEVTVLSSKYVWFVGHGGHIGCLKDGKPWLKCLVPGAQGQKKTHIGDNAEIIPGGEALMALILRCAELEGRNLQGWDCFFKNIDTASDILTRDITEKANKKND